MTDDSPHGAEALAPAPPGACVDWESFKRSLPPIQGDEALVRRIWQETDALAYTFIWQCLLSF